MIAIVFEAVFVPVFIVVGILAGKRYRLEQRRRMEAYRNSPQSRLLHLND